MQKFKPFPLHPKMTALIKSQYNIQDNDEANQPYNVRKFFKEAAAIIEAPKVEKEDREIVYNNIKVSISILRPIGSKDKVLPVILFLYDLYITSFIT